MAFGWTFLLVLILLLLLGSYLYQNRRDVLENVSSLSLVGSVLVAMVFLGRVFSLIGWAEAKYLNPSALAGLLLTLLIDQR